MPTIERNTIRTAPQHKCKEGKALQIHNLYNSKRWRLMRDAWLQQHPFCERCLKRVENGTITAPNAATEVHHIKPISTAQNAFEMATLAYDYGNIIAVCHDCHVCIHKELGKWEKKERH